MNSTQKEIVNIFYEEIWNKNKMEMIPKILNEKLIFRGSIGEIKKGHNGFIEYHALIKKSLKNYKCKILELIEEDNKISAKMQFSGLHDSEFLGFKATNKNIEWTGVAIFTFKDKKINDIWVLGDIINLLNQLSNEEGIQEL